MRREVLFYCAMLLRATLLLATTLVALCPDVSLAAGARSQVVKSEEPSVPWSFQPLRSVALPKVREARWPQTRTDRFLLAKMEAAGLKPAPDAPATVLVRRLFFDVIGLPPSPAESERWSKELNRGGALDRAAYARLVDELLASPHYGERWGRYWLDLARYVDLTESWLDPTGSAWRYRDWVVRALNEDMPYNEFIKRQLATDLMPGMPLEDRYALGFLGLSPTYFKELLLPPEIIKGTVADEWEEHVDAVGRTFLGLTVGCARCHNHKFDPVSTADYYALAGVFASVRIVERPTISEALWTPVAKAKEEVARLQKEIVDLKAKKPAPADLAAKTTEIEAKIASLERTTPNYHAPMANGVEDAALFVISAGEGKGTKLDYHPGMARDLEIQKRGNPNTTGAVVPRRFLSAFPAKDGKPRRFVTGSGRLDLAEAIVEDATPLTARVMVNRVWKNHFGRGIVETPSEFGVQGDAPTHPDLLNDLTARFVANGWSLKFLHREILLSAAWQQSSLAPVSERRDPENKLVARMSRRRLDVEAWRDAILSVSGTLDLRLGGVAEEIASEKNRRRTLYGTVHRHELDAMLRLHDFPDPSSHSPARTETTSPLQMLFTLNSPFALGQADAFAARIERESPMDWRKRVRHAYTLTFQRAPSQREMAAAEHFFGTRSNDRLAWTEYAQALLGSNEFLFLD